MQKVKTKKIVSKEPVVLQVLPELNHGGVEVGTVEIATELKKNNIKNFVASKGGRMVYDLTKVGVKHFTLPLKSKNPFVIYRNTKALEKIIKENKINIVHARSRAPAWSAYFAAKKCKVKYLTTFHGTYGLGPWGIKKVYNKVMTFGQLVIAISNHIKNHMIENYGVDPKKIRLIHRCVNIDRFAPEKVSKERLIKACKENALPEDKPILMLVGRLTHWKGQHLFLEALSKIKDKEFVAVLVGSDQGKTKYTNYLKGLVKEYGLTEKVCFIEESFDIPALIMLADVVFSTAIEPEAFGRAAIEAQAMGKIVIASNHGGSLENMIDGVTGKLFENNNAQSLADAITWALSLSDKEKQKISKAGIENVRKQFTKQIMCDKTIAVYRELLNKK